MFIGHFYFHLWEVSFQLSYFSIMFFASLLIHRSSYAFCTISALSIICLLISCLTLWFIFSPYLLCFWWREYLNFHIVESLLWLVFVFYFYKNILLSRRIYIPLYSKSFCTFKYICNLFWCMYKVWYNFILLSLNCQNIIYWKGHIFSLVFITGFITSKVSIYVLFFFSGLSILYCWSICLTVLIPHLLNL